MERKGECVRVRVCACARVRVRVRVRVQAHVCVRGLEGGRVWGVGV